MAIISEHSFLCLFIQCTGHPAASQYSIDEFAYILGYINKHGAHAEKIMDLYQRLLGNELFR